MYCIIVYDIKLKRIQKVHKILKKYLFWTQNSTFEGELSQGLLNKLKKELHNVIKNNEDSIMIYKLQSDYYLEKESIGINKSKFFTNII